MRLYWHWLSGTTARCKTYWRSNITVTYYIRTTCVQNSFCSLYLKGSSYKTVLITGANYTIRQRENSGGKILSWNSPIKQTLQGIPGNRAFCCKDFSHQTYLTGHSWGKCAFCCKDFSHQTDLTGHSWGKCAFWCKDFSHQTDLTGHSWGNCAFCCKDSPHQTDLTGHSWGKCAFWCKDSPHQTDLTGHSWGKCAFWCKDFPHQTDLTGHSWGKCAFWCKDFPIKQTSQGIAGGNAPFGAKISPTKQTSQGIKGMWGKLFLLVQRFPPSNRHNVHKSSIPRCIHETPGCVESIWAQHQTYVQTIFFYYNSLSECLLSIHHWRGATAHGRRWGGGREGREAWQERLHVDCGGWSWWQSRLSQ